MDFAPEDSNRPKDSIYLIGRNIESTNLSGLEVFDNFVNVGGWRVLGHGDNLSPALA
jgi:hypothetical protein